MRNTSTKPFKPHIQEAEILEFIRQNKVLKGVVILSECETIKDVEKFLKTQETIIKNKVSKRQYYLAVDRLRKFKKATQ